MIGEPCKTCGESVDMPGRKLYRKCYYAHKKDFPSYQKYLQEKSWKNAPSYKKRIRDKSWKKESSGVFIRGLLRS